MSVPVATGPNRKTVRAARPLPTARDVGIWLVRYGMVVFLITLVVVTSILDHHFLTKSNLLNLLVQWAPPGLMAIGMTFVIISRGFDLSVGGTYAAASVLCAGAALHHSFGVALLVTLVMGAVIGLANGVLITVFDVNPFIATLGIGYIVTGLAEVASTATPIFVSSPSFGALGTGHVLGVPTPGWLLIIGLLIGGVVLSRGVYGRNIYAIGGNPEASRLSGVRTRSMTSLAYVITGILAALGGAIIASRLGDGEADIGTNIELQVITIVIVGGTAMSGGEGSMWRTVVGLAILAVLGNAFDQLGVSVFWQEVIEGAIIIGAVAIDSYGRRRWFLTSRPVRRRAPPPIPTTEPSSPAERSGVRLRD